MAETTQKKTQKAKPKKQSKKVKAASTVNVVVRTQAVAVNSKVGGKRAPRRRAEPASAAVAYSPAPMFYSSTPAPIVVRPPNYDIPPVYEPVKLPVVDVQNIPKPSLPEKPITVSVETETEPVKPTAGVGTQTTQSLSNKQLYDYAKFHNVRTVKQKMKKSEMLKLLENAGHYF